MEHLWITVDGLVRSLDGLAGGFGLFVVAFFDSSLLSLPEVNDLLLVYFSARYEERAYYYALMTVAGSASGASLLYWLARWKGHGYVRRKFAEERIDSVFALFRRFGVLAVAVPAVLPPPFPFKIFVLSSGLAALPYARFLAAILAGRSIRYVGEAYLAVRYGEHAVSYLRENVFTVLYAGLGVLAIGITAQLVVLARRRRRSRREGPALDVRPVEEP